MNTMWNWLQNLTKPGCRVAAPLMTKHRFAAHTLTPTERARLDAHLAVCGSCCAEANTVRAVETVLRKRGRAALPAVVPAADLWDRIETRIIAEQETRRRAAPLRPALLFAPVLAAAVVAVVLLPKAKTDAPATEMATASAVATGNVALNAAPAGAMSDAAPVASAPVAAVVAEAEPPRVVMNAPMTLPRQTAPVATSSPQNRAKTATKPVAPRARATDYVVVTMVPLVRETRPVAVAARDGAKPPVRVAVAPAPAPAAPRLMADAAAPLVSAPTFAAPAFVPPSKTITVVTSDAGTGVPETASPVTDTLIRQRQKRGLFGGYGATLAALPTGGDAAP